MLLNKWSKKEFIFLKFYLGLKKMSQAAMSDQQCSENSLKEL